MDTSRTWCAFTLGKLGLGSLCAAGVVGIAWLGLSAPARAQGPGRDPRLPPNVLLIIADDVGWRDISPHAPTPNIDLLRSQGLTFTRAYSMPVCSPTRYSVMFGRYGFRDGVGDKLDSYHPPSETNPAPAPTLFSLPRMMKARGYGTMLAGKWHLGATDLGCLPLTPNLYGFDSYAAGSLGNLAEAPQGSGYFDWLRVDAGAFSLSTEYATSAVRNAALQWWTNTEAPRFAVVAFQAAHLPLHVPPPELLPKGYPPPRTARQKFEAAVVAMDTALGDILSLVDLTDTYVFFLSDNGTPLEAAASDQDPNKVKGTTFEGGIHVPFVVAGPDVPVNQTTDTLIHTVDLVATLAALLGERLPIGVAEDSIPFYEGWKSPREVAYAEVFTAAMVDPPGTRRPPDPGDEDGHVDRAAFTRRYKLREVNDEQELYDLVLDPAEEHPLDPDTFANQGVVRRLRLELERLQ